MPLKMDHHRPISETPLKWRYAAVLNAGLVALSSADPEGGQGVRTPPPPGKSQVIWVSIGNKQLDPPPPPLEKVGHPPPPWKM